MTANSIAEKRALCRGGRLRGLQEGVRELDDEPVRIEGALPHWLRGNLLLNGPAQWKLPHGGFGHWFDGHAMLHRVSLGLGEARYRSRFQQSDDFRASRAAGRPAYGGFAAPDPQHWWQRVRHLGKPRMTDNGAVVLARIGRDWVAHTETPLLTRFDPDTLETLGRYDFEDEEVIHLASAHAITDRRGVYWNVGVELGARCTYKLFCVQPGTRKRTIAAHWKVPRSGYLHGFALTPRHAVVWEPALKAQPLGFIFTGRSYIENFRWSPEDGGNIHVVTLGTGQVKTWAVPPFFAFHAIQAFDEGDSVILDLCTSRPDVVQALTLDRLRSGEPFTVPHEALRYRLEFTRSEAEPKRIGEHFDLPMVHGAYWTRRRARLAWAAGLDPDQDAPFFDRTVKVDLDAPGVLGTWQRPEAVHMEPLFVERPGSMDEEDGVLLVPTLSDSDSGSVIGVIDAATMQPMALLHLPQVVPFGFHAAWDARP